MATRGTAADELEGQTSSTQLQPLIISVIMNEKYFKIVITIFDSQAIPLTDMQ